MDEYYEYHEYRPDHFVKLKHGEVISKISKAIFRGVYRDQKYCGPIWFSSINGNLYILDR